MLRICIPDYKYYFDIYTQLKYILKLCVIGCNMMETVEIEVIKTLQREEYTLNTVNGYGENLLHFSAANGCLNIVKEILQKYDSYEIINKKNKLGWTPLMLAIRNRKIETVKYLLEKNADVNESTYLGMSVLGLAAAVNKDMFETVYKACPTALLNSKSDDITPLCIAAMKNDRSLFFKLIELGFDGLNNNNCTYIMMKQSTIPEIRDLAKKQLDIENYWNDKSNNITVESESDEEDLNIYKSVKEKEKTCPVQNNYIQPVNVTDLSKFTFNSKKSDTDNFNNNIKKYKNFLKPLTLNITSEELNVAQHNSISPTLTCELVPVSPNIYFTEIEYSNKTDCNTEDKQENENKLITHSKHEINSTHSQVPLQRLQSIRPPDLIIQNEEENLNTTIGYMPTFSPLRSANVPPDINDENVFVENTPTPPRYKTPPTGIILSPKERKLFILLRHYGLCQYWPIFLQQEVDIDLFITLTNEDLIEIGFENEADREVILHAIVDYKNVSMI